MTGLAIIELLWEAGKTAYEIATGLKKKKEEDRKKLSVLFGHIGQLLHETYLELDHGNYPAGHCHQISIFGNEIKQNFKKLIGESKAEKLSALLLTAHQVELLYGMLASGEVEKAELIKLEESSGEFIAASKLILF